MRGRSTDVSARLVFAGVLHWCGMKFDDRGTVLGDNSIHGRSGLYVRYHVQVCSVVLDFLAVFEQHALQRPRFVVLVLSREVVHTSGQKYSPG